MENETENRINLDNYMLNPAELAVREFERSLELKTMVETKAVNYMVAVTLILTMLTTFFIEFNKLDMEKTCWIAFTVMYILDFMLGIVLMFVFVYMMKPRDIKYLTFKELAEMVTDNKLTTIEKAKENTASILKDCEISIETNKRTVNKLDCLNDIVKTCVPILVSGFFTEFVIFVVSIIICKGDFAK